MLLTDLLSGSVSAPPDLKSNPEILGLTADSREVEAGYLFAALPGTQVNGCRVY